MLRQKVPDRKNALSMAEAAKRDMDFTLSLDINERSGSTIVRNIYECFRMLGESLLIAKGIRSEDHVTPVNELLSLEVKTSRPINVISNLRILRHNINYSGYKPNILEVQDAVSIAKCCFEPLFKEVIKKLK